MSHQLKVLVTGFVPFLGDPYNPSGVTAKWLHGKTLHTGRGKDAFAARIIGKGDIPVRFVDEGNGGAKAVENLIINNNPDVVLGLGMAAEIFEVEKKAHDLGRDPSITQKSAGYSNSFDTSLPVDAVVKAIAESGGRVQSDSDAGAYVCEDVFYHIMRMAKASAGDIRILRAGFIHVPKYVVLDDNSTPNVVPSGVTPVAQSLINNAIYQAVEAIVADITVEQYNKAHGIAPGVRGK